MIEKKVIAKVCVLQIDAPPLNALTEELLARLTAAVSEADAAEAVKGIVITGRPDHFSAGADLQAFQQIRTGADAVRASRLFQEAFHAISLSETPVVAAMAGSVMGGALELGMFCHYRVCSADSRFSMPEVRLGFNPGAGGTQNLPRLVGVKAALEMLLTAQTVSAREARDMGLVDCIADGELVAAAIELLSRVDGPRRACEFRAKLSDADESLAYYGTRVSCERPEIIAPRKIVEAVGVGLTQSFEAGLLAEQQAFAACMDTLATRNRIYCFFAGRKTSKVPDLAEVAPRRIAAPAVVGMGTMGTGIVHAFIMRGFSVVVREEDGAAVERGLGRIRNSLDRRIQQGQMTEEEVSAMLARVTVAESWADLADADLVVEAVFEDMSIKGPVLQQIESAVAPDTIIASNTSTFSLDLPAERMTHPERLIGMHFFNPAQRMPLVEVIRREGTPPEPAATAMALLKALGKTPVLVKNREGFLVNRIFIPYLREALALVEEGADPHAVDQAMLDFGFAMGPLTLTDMAGVDILLFTQNVMARTFPWHGPLSPVAQLLVMRGQLGQKRGAGIYKYEKGDYTTYASPVTQQVIAEVQQELGRRPRQIAPPEITERLVLRLVNEAFYVLEEGLAQRESDIDTAMVLATGFPDFRGGVLKYARDRGIDEVRQQLSAFAERYGKQFTPCELLKNMKGASDHG